MVPFVVQSYCRDGVDEARSRKMVSIDSLCNQECRAERCPRLQGLLVREGSPKNESTSHKFLGSFSALVLVISSFTIVLRNQMHT